MGSFDIIINYAEEFIKENGRTPTYIELSDIIKKATGKGVSWSSLSQHYKPWRDRKQKESGQLYENAATGKDDIPKQLAEVWSLEIKKIRDETNSRIQHACIEKQSLQLQLDENEMLLQALETETEQIKEKYDLHLKILLDVLENKNDEFPKIYAAMEKLENKLAEAIDTISLLSSQLNNEQEHNRFLEKQCQEKEREVVEAKEVYEGECKKNVYPGFKLFRQRQLKPGYVKVKHYRHRVGPLHK